VAGDVLTARSSDRWIESQSDANCSVAPWSDESGWDGKPMDYCTTCVDGALEAEQDAVPATFEDTSRIRFSVRTEECFVWRPRAVVAVAVPGRERKKSTQQVRARIWIAGSDAGKLVRNSGRRDAGAGRDSKHAAAHGRHRNDNGETPVLVDDTSPGVVPGPIARVVGELWLARTPPGGSAGGRRRP
jgi:hypothetical protein